MVCPFCPSSSPLRRPIGRLDSDWKGRPTFSPSHLLCSPAVEHNVGKGRKRGGRRDDGSNDGRGQPQKRVGREDHGGTAAKPQTRTSEEKALRLAMAMTGETELDHNNRKTLLYLLLLLLTITSLHLFISSFPHQCHLPVPVVVCHHRLHLIHIPLATPLPPPFTLATLPRLASSLPPPTQPIALPPLPPPGCTSRHQGGRQAGWFMGKEEGEKGEGKEHCIHLWAHSQFVLQLQS